MQKKQNPHTLLGIKRSGTATVKNNLAVSQKIKHGDAIWSNFTPRHLPKREKWKHMFMQKRVNKCHSSIIYDSQMVEIIQMPTYQWMDKQNPVNPHNGILFRHKKKKEKIKLIIWHMLQHGWTWKNYVRWKTDTKATCYMISFTWNAQHRQSDRQSR